MKVNGSLRLNAYDLKLRETVQVHWTVTAPAGATIDDVLKPVFWTHVTTKLHTLDEINVIAFDASWYARMLVTFADGADVRVHLLDYTALSDDIGDDKDEDSLFRVSWGGAAQLFRVVRKVDNHVVHHGCRSRKEATKWINERPK